eukprot:COSAG05_NODE_454_length_9643_cov_5.989627_1_plen_168_part_00
MNGGTCTDVGDSYTCSCAAGYLGSDCQTTGMTGDGNSTNSSNVTNLPRPYSRAACPAGCVYTAEHEVAAPEPEPARATREDSRLILWYVCIEWYNQQMICRSLLLLLDRLLANYCFAVMGNVCRDARVGKRPCPRHRRSAAYLDFQTRGTTDVEWRPSCPMQAMTMT